MRAQYKAYQDAARTMNPALQVVMLYDAVITYVKQAQLAIDEKNYDLRYSLIEKAMSVVRGLRSCLDFEAAENVALAMDKYYDALDKLMIEVQASNDRDICDELIKDLLTIKNAWMDINLLTKPSDSDSEPGGKRPNVVI